MSEHGERTTRNLSRRLKATLAVASFSLTGACSSGGVATGGECTPYTIYAQNRWSPQGASIRDQPLITADKIGSLAGNEIVTVDGWEVREAAYPRNLDPWKGETWFRLSIHVVGTKDGTIGWVNSAAVRQTATTFDPTGLDKDGGTPANKPSECEIK